MSDQEDNYICRLCDGDLEEDEIVNFEDCEFDLYEGYDKELILCEKCFDSCVCGSCGNHLDKKREILYLIDNYNEVDKCIYCLLEELNLENNNKHNNNIYKNKTINSVLQIKFNKLKNQIKNNCLKKDIKINFKGRTYNFKSNNKSNNIKKVYTRSNYFIKYKNRITGDDINKQDNICKNNKIKSDAFWEDFKIRKDKSKENINKIFQNDPIINVDIDEYYGKNVFENKKLTYLYECIIKELDKLDKEYNNLKTIENIYNKIKDNKYIANIFKDNKNKLNNIFIEYENNKINEYNVLKNIGDLIINNKLSKNETKEINSLSENSRPARIIKQSRRIYLLEKFVNIKNIALSGISNWLRDTSDDNFNILLSFFNYNRLAEEDILDLEYFSDDEPNNQIKKITKIVFT